MLFFPVLQENFFLFSNLFKRILKNYKISSDYPYLEKKEGSLYRQGAFLFAITTYY